MIFYLLLGCVSQVLEGDQRIDGVNRDGWIMLFAKDPTVTDMFKSEPNIDSDDDKEEKNLCINRLVVFFCSCLPSVLSSCCWLLSYSACAVGYAN